MLISSPKGPFVVIQSQTPFWRLPPKVNVSGGLLRAAGLMWMFFSWPESEGNGAWGISPISFYFGKPCQMEQLQENSTCLYLPQNGPFWSSKVKTLFRKSTPLEDFLSEGGGMFPSYVPRFEESSVVRVILIRILPPLPGLGPRVVKRFPARPGASLVGSGVSSVFSDPNRVLAHVRAGPSPIPDFHQPISFSQCQICPP